MTSRTLKMLNTPEAKRDRVKRLLKEAKGTREGVSVIAACEFRREQYGLSRRQFAEVLGIYGSHYSEFVNGDRDLPIGAVRRAYAIGVPAGVLLQPKRKKPT